MTSFGHVMHFCFMIAFVPPVVFPCACLEVFPCLGFFPWQLGVLSPWVPSLIKLVQDVHLSLCTSLLYSRLKSCKHSLCVFVCLVCLVNTLCTSYQLIVQIETKPKRVLNVNCHCYAWVEHGCIVKCIID